MLKIKNKLSTRKVFFIAFFIQIIWYSLFLVIYYPGIYSTDSIVQWDQSLKDVYSNTHPFLHTFVVDIFQTLFRTPAAMAFFQIVLSSFVFASFFELFHTNKLDRKILIVFFAFVLINPIVLVYNINTWKDTLYSYILLFLLFRILKDLINKKPLNLKYILLISFLVAVAASFRFNGLINIVLVPFIYFTLKLFDLKKSLLFLGTIVLIYITFQYGFATFLNVRNSTLRYYSERQRMTFLGAALQNPDIKVSEEESAAISAMGEDIQRIKQCYQCSNSRWISRCSSDFVISRFNDKKLFSNYSNAINSILLRNIDHIIKDRICSARFVTGLRGDGSNYKFDTKIVDNDFGIERTETFTNLRQIADSYFYNTDKGFFALVFWSPFVGILVALFYFIYGLFKKNKILVGVSLFVLGNAFFLLAINISNHVRYLMIVQLFFIISIPLFLVFRKEK